MNKFKCPVPREQQPTNEFVELSKSAIFSSPKNKIPNKVNTEIIEKISIIFFNIGFTSIEAMSDSFSFKLNGFIQT